MAHYSTTIIQREKVMVTVSDEFVNGGDEEKRKQQQQFEYNIEEVDAERK